MRLLICTQSVDSNDPVLGFFVRWIEEFAKRYERVTIICLREGAHALPGNVRVYSLGKEKGARSVFIYASRFISLVWRLRREYDLVFVHMNQEYVLIAGWLWKLLRKRVYLWRNHYVGGILTNITAAFCTKIFCTSKFSYTAKYKKAILMPVGIDTDVFKLIPSISRAPGSILFFGRLAPSKRPELLLEALGVLHERNINFSATFCGPAESPYMDFLERRTKELGLMDKVAFRPAVQHAEAPRLFSEHEVYVNCSPSGMYDKTIFEAAMCRCIVLASNQDFAGIAMSHLVFEEDNPVDLAGKIAKLLTLRSVEREEITDSLKKIAERNNLTALGNALIKEMQNASSV